MKSSIIIASLALCAIPAKSDTIRVETVQAVPPVCVSMPYMTDSTTMDGKAFGVRQTLDNNASLALNRTAYTTTLKHGEGFASPKGAPHALTALRFGFTADRFVKGRLEVKQLRNFRTYINGKLVTSKDLQFTPGPTEITLLALTDSTHSDTLDIAITGNDLKGLSFSNGGKHVYTMADMIQGDHYRSVALSPSGDYLVTVYYYTKADGSNLFRTVVTNMVTGREVLRLGQYMDLNWLPGRDVLYFTRQGADGRELVTFDPRTGKEHVLANCLPEGSFRLSPQEDYAIIHKGQPSRLEHVGGLKRLEQPDDRMPGWRNRNALSRFDLKTGLITPLTFGEASVWLNDISADGRRLLLSYSRQEVNRAPFNRTTLVEMDAYTGKIDTLLADTVFLSSALYSPDAGQVMVKASPAAFGGIGNETRAGQNPNSFDYRLYLLDIKSRKVQPVLRGFSPSVGDFMWSKGDRNVYFQATDQYDEGLFRLNPENGKVFRYELPVSYVQGFTVASLERQPRAVFFGQTGERARDMYTCRLSDKPQTKTTRLGDIDFDALMADVKIGTCHNWDFRASRGDTIKGFYFLPPDFDESKKYPVIVYYYGGCTPTAKTLEFHYPLQVLAGQGYVVYVVEPSGAIGFGQEFAARHVNTWGQGSADDIIEGTKAFLAAHSWADDRKVGCMGASYGGFMTQYLQTRTDIFAAAISHAGISNIASYWGGGNWGYTYGETAQYGSYPWNNPELYVKQSPLFNADKIKTPLLLLHGTVDTNVPTNESQQLFTALRILGRPVSYIQIDGENHVITNYNKRLAWQNVIFAWFAHWLKDEPTWWKTLYPDDKFGLK